MSRKHQQPARSDSPQGGAVVRFEPKNDAQRRASRAFAENDIIFLVGPAGGGKTAAAVGLALQYAQQSGGRVSVCRPAVEASAGLGFAKGTIEEKYALWLGPVFENAKKFVFSPSGVERMIEMCPMPYLRGATFESAAILDEAQNCTVGEILLFMTRLGKGGKLFISGDPFQTDIGDDSGLEDWMDAMEGVPRVARIYFPEDQCLRHPLVREVIRRQPR